MDPHPVLPLKNQTHPLGRSPFKAIRQGANTGLSCKINDLRSPQHIPGDAKRCPPGTTWVQPGDSPALHHARMHRTRHYYDACSGNAPAISFPCNGTLNSFSHLIQTMTSTGIALPPIGVSICTTIFVL